jgi:lipopolysaccharide transport system ATP-binding protein
VVISIGIFTMRGEGVLHLSNETSGDPLGEIPSEGSLICEFDTAGLLPGRYSLNVLCTVNGVVADWVVDAATIEVAEGDYYGTGKLPPAGYGSVLVPYHWTVGP